MNILRSLSLAVLATPLLIGATAPSIQLPQTTIVNSSKAVVNTATATLNVSNTILINGHVYINGTILRSINNELPQVYYRPKFSSIKFIKADVEKKFNKGAVYTGQFDLNPVKQSLPELNSREFKILGRDIILKSESYDGYNYSASEMSSTSPDRESAIMALYKALGKNIYSVSYYPQNAASDISINSSPLLSVVHTPAVQVNKEGYYTDVFVTRTVPDQYWNQAENDGILLRGQSKTSSLTVGEFCNYVKEMLYLNGEPVMTQQEEEMLMTDYGRNIPYYLPSDEVSSVEYLMARGIVDDSLNFKSTLTRSEMLTILMRAKDPNSRLTFKKVTAPYIKSLVQKGYYPTETDLTNTPIYNASWSTKSVSVSKYYDYYVKIVPKETITSMRTIFTTKSGTDNSNIYISSEFNKNSSPYPGSEYVGKDNGFYHFRVPIDIIQDPSAIECDEVQGTELIPIENKSKCYYNPTSKDPYTYKAFITLNSSNSSDSPGNIQLEYGGGVYMTAQPRVINPGNHSDDEYVMYRQPFTPDYSSNLVDRERKIESQGSITGPVPLSVTSTDSVLTFYSNDISSLMWDGKPITEASVFSKVSGSDNEYKLTLSGSSPYKQLMSMLTTTDLTKCSNNSSAYNPTTGTCNVGTSPAYVKNDRSALVSLSYLEKNGVLDSATKLSSQTCPDSNGGSKQCGIYMLYSNRSNILVDTVNRLIVSGQTVTEIPKSDPSPLIITDPQTGDMLIDARAVMGVASNLLIVKSSNGSVSVSLTKNNGPDYRWNTIYPLLGGSDGRYIRTNDDPSNMRIYLEDSYPLSNFLVYRKRSSSVNEDFLIVFKPRISSIQGAVSPDLVNTLKNDFHIKLGSMENAAIYQLTSGTTYQTNFKKALGISSDKYGYYYDPTSLKNFNFFGYLKDTGITEDKSLSNVYPIPIVYTPDGVNAQLVDLNVDILKANSPGEYPSALMNSSVRSFTHTSGRFVFNANGPGYTNNYSDAGNFQYGSWIAAPVGIQSKYYPANPTSWKSLVNKIVYFGTMQAEVLHKVGLNNSYYELAVKGANVNSIEIPDQVANAQAPFSEIFRGTRTSIYAYSSSGESSLLDFTSTKVGTTTPTVVTTIGSKNVFDWLSLKYKTQLQNADDLMTISILFLLGVIPRIMLFLLIGYATLTLGKDNRIVRYVCENWIDLYKVFSFGITDINRITVRGIWLSTFFAIVLLTMLNSGQILSVFAWITRGVQGIMHK